MLHCRLRAWPHAAEEGPIDIFRKLFARRQASPRRKKLPLIVRAFIDADSWADSRRILEANPELLQPEKAVERVFARLIKEAHDQDELERIPYLTVHRAVLRRTREVGADAAFAEIGCFLEAAAAGKGVSAHPLYRLGWQVLNGSVSMEQALEEALAPSTLAGLDDEALRRLNEHIKGMLDDWRRVEENRVLAELNAAAAQARPAPPEVQALLVGTLGDALGCLIPTSPAQRESLLQRRVELYREVLSIWEDLGESEQAGRTWNSLGVVLSQRFQVQGETSVLDEAITAFEGGLAVAVNPSERARGQAGLGEALLARFEAHKRVGDLDQAVAVLEGRLALAESALDRAQGEVALGRALFRRFQARGQAEDLDRAIVVLEKSVSLTPTDSADWVRGQILLGQAFGARWERSGGPADRNGAVEAYEAVLTALPVDVFPEYLWAAVVPLARLLLHQRSRGGWKRAAQAYAAAQEAAYYLRLEELPAEDLPHSPRPLQGLVAGRAYALGQLGDLGAAVGALEAGCVRLFAELSLEQRALQRLPDANWRSTLQAASQRVRKNAAGYGRAAEPQRPWATARLAEARRDYHHLAQVLFPELAAAPSLEAIREAAADVPLVYLAVTPVGGLALVVYAGAIEPVWLDIAVEDLHVLLLGQAGEGGSSGYLSLHTSPGDVKEALNQILPLLGERVMGPLAEVLRVLVLPEGTARVTLIPVGLLALLPLHAAVLARGEGEACFLDEFMVTYAPSAQALAVARREVERRAAAPLRLAGLGDPSADPLASDELAYIATLFSGRAARLLEPGEATRGMLLAALAEATVAHFSAPASSDLAAPLDSGIRWAGGRRLTLRHLLRPAGKEALSRLRVLVLSNAHTILGDPADLSDEAIGLPAGLLQAEVPAVVGTLWPVRGHGRLLLMARFYELMLGAGLLPAAALREAQCWLRDLTYAALLAYLKTAPGLPGTAAATRETSGALWAELSDVVRQSVQAGKGAERPYATPQHWAGFVCYGALSY